MSLLNAKAYFITHLNALGFKEWADVATNNIPSTVLDKAYHLDFSNNSTSPKQNQNDVVINQLIDLTVYRKGYRTVSQGIESCLSDFDSISRRVLNPIRKLNYEGIHNVNLVSFSVSPYGETDDNVCVLKITFSVQIYLNPNL